MAWRLCGGEAARSLDPRLVLRTPAVSPRAVGQGPSPPAAGAAGHRPCRPACGENDVCAAGCHVAGRRSAPARRRGRGLCRPAAGHRPAVDEDAAGLPAARAGLSLRARRGFGPCWCHLDPLSSCGRGDAGRPQPLQSARSGRVSAGSGGFWHGGIRPDRSGGRGWREGCGRTTWASRCRSPSPAQRPGARRSE